MKRSFFHDWHALCNYTGMTKRIFTTLLLAGLILAGGCARHDFSTEVGDPRGVAELSPVMHYEIRVGTISKVRPTESGVRMDIKLDKQFKETFRSDLKACPIKAGKKTGVPTLVLIGGRDATMPLLKRGTMIPEASPLDVGTDSTHRFAKKYLVAIGTILSLFLVLCKLLKGLFKFILLGGLVAALLYCAYCLKNDISFSRIASVQSEEITNWLRENKEWIEGAATTIFNIEELKNEF